MKQKTLLFTLITGFSCLTLSSYINGPAAGGAGNRTGSGTTANASCNGGGCHAANNSALSVTIVITDTANSTPITSYTPGKKYMLRLAATTSTLTQSKFGFQASAVMGSSITTQAGTLSLGAMSTPSASAIKTSGGIQLFEHTGAVAATSTSPLTYAAACYWTAPAAGSGQVKLFGVINAVNGNNSESGDAPNNATTTITEHTASVETTTANAIFKVYPNPAINVVNVTVDGIASGTWNINTFDLRGKMIANQTADASNGVLNTAVNSSRWAAGMYFIQIEKDGQEKIIAVVKQ